MNDFKKIQIVRKYFFDIEYQYPYEIKKRQNEYKLISNKNLTNGWKFAQPFLHKIPQFKLYGEGDMDFSAVFPSGSKKDLHLNSFSDDKPVYYGQIENVNIVFKANSLIQPFQAYMLGLEEEREKLWDRVQEYTTEILKAISDSLRIEIPIGVIIDFINGFLELFPPSFVDIIEGNDEISLKKAFKKWVSKKSLEHKKYGKLNTKQQNLLKGIIEHFIVHFSQIKLFNVCIVLIDGIVDNIFGNKNTFQSIGECSDGLKEAVATKCVSNLVENHYCPFFPILYGTFLVRRDMTNEPTEITTMMKEDISSDLKEPLSDMLKKQKILPYNLEFEEWEKLITEILCDIGLQSMSNYFLYLVLVEQHTGKSMIDEISRLHKEETIYNSLLLESLIGQGMMAIYCLAKGCGIGNTDLHLRNVTIEPIDKNIQFYFQITEGSETFYYRLASRGYQLRLIDLETAYILSEKEKYICFSIRGISHLSSDVAEFLSGIMEELTNYKKSDDYMKAIYGGPRILIKTLYNAFFPNYEKNKMGRYNSNINMKNIFDQFPLLMKKISKETFQSKTEDSFTKIYIIN